MKEKKDYVNVRLLIFNLMLFYIYIDKSRYLYPRWFWCIMWCLSNKLFGSRCLYDRNRILKLKKKCILKHLKYILYLYFEILKLKQKSISDTSTKGLMHNNKTINCIEGYIFLTTHNCRTCTHTRTGLTHTVLLSPLWCCQASRMLSVSFCESWNV